MIRHILILGNNLTGLVTAYRLLHYGFHVSIIGIKDETPSHISSGANKKTEEPLALARTGSKQYNHPLILHGFYRATWSLLQELTFEWPAQTGQAVRLELGNHLGSPITFPKPSRIAWVHPMTRLLLFKGLSWSDSWNIINFLEKQWEENRLSAHHPDIQSAESWIITAKQSDHSRTHFWNPLCRLLLHCNLSEASLRSFIEVFSHYWFGQPTDALTYLTSFGMVEKLETQLRQWLINKETQFHTSIGPIQLHTDNEGIQRIALGHDNLSAHAYVSALPPKDLLPLLPERVLARFSYFSSLAHIPEVYSLAVQFTIKNTLLPPRLILHINSFDWITSQPNSQASEPKTMLTLVTLEEPTVQQETVEELIHKAWACLQSLFHLSPTQTLESSQPQVIRLTSPFYPCQLGSQTHRPLPKTPLSNFFLAGPWTASRLPDSMESTIQSATTCAETLSSAFYRFPV